MSTFVRPDATQTTRLPQSLNLLSHSSSRYANNLSKGIIWNTMGSDPMVKKFFSHYAPRQDFRIHINNSSNIFPDNRPHGRTPHRNTPDTWQANTSLSIQFIPTHTVRSSFTSVMLSNFPPHSSKRLRCEASRFIRFVYDDCI